MDKLKQNTNADFEQILLLIQEARNRVYSKANAELVMLYFNVGKVVSEKVRAGKWGESTVDELANFIQSSMPSQSGFNRRGLYRMKQFSESYSMSSECFLLWIQSKYKNVSPVVTQNPETLKQQNLIVSPLATQLQNPENQHEEFVSAVLTQIAWSHHLEIFSAVKDSAQRLFYLLMCIKEKWSKTELRRQIQTASFERTMMGNQIVSAVQTQLPEGIFKDPYIFEFLDLPETHSENDLEKALILHLQKFILEIGKGFTYMGNQFRLQVGNKDYYTDLLFYHRDLQCLV